MNKNNGLDHDGSSRYFYGLFGICCIEASPIFRLRRMLLGFIMGRMMTADKKEATTITMKKLSQPHVSIIFTTGKPVSAAPI